MADLLFHGGNLDGGIKKGGPFSGFLFFGGYRRMGLMASEVQKVYTCDLGDLAIAEPTRWRFDPEMYPLVERDAPEVAELLGCDIDTAERALCDFHDWEISNLVSALDDPWTIQRWVCELAREGDYAAVSLQDENGSSVAIDALHPEVVIVDEETGLVVPRVPGWL